jgi:phenylalanyl-tRNA synthetase alpha chain
MLDKVKALIEEVKQFETESHEELEKFRIKFLGKKGVLTDLFAEFKNVEPQLKKDFGQALNELKVSANNKINDFKSGLEQAQTKSSLGDLTRPSEPIELGSRHPISLVKNQIIEVFSKIGFNVSEGPEIEDDWHNFTALNLPEYHPARDMQDTFFLLKKTQIFC